MAWKLAPAERPGGRRAIEQDRANADVLAAELAGCVATVRRAFDQWRAEVERLGVDYRTVLGPADGEQAMHRVYELLPQVPAAHRPAGLDVLTLYRERHL